MLNLKSDRLLSSFAFKINLRRYTWLMALLESRVGRVQHAAAAAVALYSSTPTGLHAVAASGDATALFDSLVQSMQDSILSLHTQDVASYGVEGGVRTVKAIVRLSQGKVRLSQGKVPPPLASSAKELTGAQLMSMSGAQGSGLWAGAYTRSLLNST